MKLFMIAKNNIKKAKVATAILVILIAIATVFLYIGTSVFANIGSFIENKNTEVNGAHFIAIMSLSSEFQDVNVGEKDYSMSSILLNLDTKRTISTVNIIDKASIVPENGIIVPYVLKISREYKTGDTLKFLVNGKSIEFEIAGFYEDLIFANSSNVSIYKLLVCDKKFKELINNPDYGSKCSYSSVITSHISNSDKYENQYTNKLKTIVPDGEGSYATLNYSTMKTGSSVFINIIMAVLVAFSIIILAISLIVIKFSPPPPLTALRNGIGTHNFKRNSVPLDKTKLDVNIVLGIKAFIYNKKQNFIVGTIIMLLSLICVFAFSMYYNFVVDNSEMIKLVGLENADAQMTA